MITLSQSHGTLTVPLSGQRQTRSILLSSAQLSAPSWVSKPPPPLPMEVGPNKLSAGAAKAANGVGGQILMVRDDRRQLGRQSREQLWREWIHCK